MVIGLSQTRALVILVGSFALLCGCGEPTALRAMDVGPSVACAGNPRSWWMDQTGRHDLATEAMGVSLFSTAREIKSPLCPMEVDIDAGGETATAAMKALSCRLGSLDFGHGGEEDSVSGSVSKAVATCWAELQAALTAASTASRPVRLLVKHYPTQEQGGALVTLQTTLYTLPDFYFGDAMDLIRGDVNALVAGVLLRIRKTYHLDGASARLVEIWIEASGGYTGGSAEVDYAALLGEPTLRADGNRHAHFEDLTPARRLGICWVDLSRGQGRAKPFARSYSIVSGRQRVGSPPRAWVDALHGIAQRL